MTEEQHLEIVKALTKLETQFEAVVTQMTIANGRTGKIEAKNELLEKVIEGQESRIPNLEKYDGGQERNAEKRKDWMWGFAQNILYTVIGAVLFLAGLVLQNLHILNLSTPK